MVGDLPSGDISPAMQHAKKKQKRERAAADLSRRTSDLGRQPEMITNEAAGALQKFCAW